MQATYKRRWCPAMRTSCMRRCTASEPIAFTAPKAAFAAPALPPAHRKEVWMSVNEVLTEKSWQGACAYLHRLCAERMK